MHKQAQVRGVGEAEGKGEADTHWAGRPTQGSSPGPQDYDLSHRQILKQLSLILFIESWYEGIRKIRISTEYK